MDARNQQLIIACVTLIGLIALVAGIWLTAHNCAGAANLITITYGVVNGLWAVFNIGHKSPVTAPVTTLDTPAPGEEPNHAQ